ncbi:MAG: Crp/Fnr family transcriptional regulator [Micavibrio aeruginosavorus]|uniref:Crp/Fnr family transcriptional regulator n=1 Tax=Micavibrio aeruginosavorus TaxID=349221 RepID=A0A7T5R1L4_9BACT|nr:MAG: Crp/Fnr family transcriptional regulator [Micavibrio aeruginosavorus]
MNCRNLDHNSAREKHYPLDTIEFFAAFPADLLKQLHASARRVSYTKGQVLFTQDDPADWFYMIESGWVKLFRETLDGDEVILDVMPPGYVFGETTMFESGVYPFGAEVVETGELTAYPVAMLADFVKGRSDLALAMLQHIVNKNIMKDRDIEHRTVMNAPQRIGCFLLRLCKIKQTPPVILHLPYDKTLIASRLGMQPETFSRALTRLQQDTGIRIRGATVEIENMGKLITYTCTACSNVFPCDND